MKAKIKGFTHKIKALTQVFKKLLFPFICLLVWIFSKTKSKSKRKETVRKTKRAEEILNKISNNNNKTYIGLISVLQGFQKCICMKS